MDGGTILALCKMIDGFLFDSLRHDLSVGAIFNGRLSHNLPVDYQALSSRSLHTPSLGSALRFDCLSSA